MFLGKNSKKTGLFKKLRREKKIEQNIVTHPDSENVPYEENVITPGEFEEIEEKEGTKLEEVEENISRGKPEAELSPMDKLVMKVERLEGKINAMDSVDKSIQDRISELSEEIGELRSSILEKEKTLNEVESKTKEVIDVFEEVKPGEIKEELEKKEEKIVNNKAALETLAMKQKELKEEIDKIKNIMEKIKSFENLVEMSEKINEKFSQIEENKKYTSRLAAKVENIFSELNVRMKEFRDAIEKVDMNEETIKELMKSVDMMEIKIDNVVTKDELEKAKKEITENKEKKIVELEDKIYDMKDFLEDIITKAGGSKFLRSKKVMPWRMELENRIKKIEKMLESSGGEEFKKRIRDIEDKINDIEKKITSVKEGMKKGGNENLKKELKEMKDRLKFIENLKPQKIDVKASEKLKKLINTELLKRDKRFTETSVDIEKKINKLDNEFRKMKNEIIGDKKDIKYYITKVIDSKVAEIRSRITQEIPINIEKWIEENLKKGYTREELKESLKKGGYNPIYVDIYFLKNNQLR